MEDIEIWLRALFMVLAVFLLFIALMAYRMEHSHFLMLVCGVLLVFLVKGVLLTIGIFSRDFEVTVQELYVERVLDIVVLAVLLIMSWHPSRRRKEKAL